jgi:hypothetical protein
MLFVQTFASGSLLPKEGEEGTFILTLNGGYGRTIGFSDRPERIVGSVPTQQFLDGLGFTPRTRQTRHWCSSQVLMRRTWSYWSS